MGTAEIKEELLADFSLQKPRVLFTDRMAVVDHVEQLLLISPEGIAAACGRFCAEVQGQGLFVESLEDGRMEVRGSLQQVRIYPQQGKGRKRP